MATKLNMTTIPTPSATWDSMNDAQKRYWLGYYVMGWKLRNYEDDLIITEKSRGNGYNIEEALNNDGFAWEGSDCDEEAYIWNPLASWDDWRQVELKMLENEKLSAEYCIQLDAFFIGYMKLPDGSLTFQNKYMQADLPTRAKALYLALQ